uniref:Dynein regulatory complex protein 1/2 N-terminal domain-containing protein n=1 Tax=Glossina austeni TaxID=7395 RepID=A0A1A9UEB4_GLOAU
MQRAFETSKTCPTSRLRESISLPELSRLPSPKQSLRHSPKACKTVQANVDTHPGCQSDAPSVQIKNQELNKVPVNMEVVPVIPPLDYCQKYHFNSGLFVDERSKIYWQMNEMFSKRLHHINNRNARNSLQLKVIACQEWVDVLHKTYDSVMVNTKQLEAEVAERLERWRCKTKVVYQNGNWDLRDRSLGPLSLSQPLIARNSGTENMCVGDAETDIKLCNNMKTLAAEIAERHKEVEELKQKLSSMEQEMQEKLQDKDKMIKDLQADLNSGYVTMSKSDVHCFLLLTLKFLSGKL